MRAGSIHFFGCVIWLTSCAASGPRPPVAEQGLYLRGATLVDPRLRTQSLANLFIRKGRIVARFDPEARPPVESEVVELGGKFLIPGLVDLHVHSWGNQTPVEGGAADEIGRPAVLERMLRAGVTAALDLGANPTEIFPLRDRQRADPDSVPGATLFAAGPVMGFGHPTAEETGYFGMSTPEEARVQVRRLAAHHPDVVKIILDHVGRDPAQGLNRSMVEAAVTEAKRLGLRTVVHIGTWRDARDAVLAGAHVITHLCDSEEIPESLVKLMRKRGVVEIPTMAVQGDLYRIAKDRGFLEDPLLVSLTPAGLRVDYRKAETTWTERANRFLKWQSVDIPIDFRSIRRLRDGKVPLLTGSDAGNVGVFQGYSTHREITLLVEAGLSPWDALAAGTTRGAEFLGLRYGFEVGDLAEFVVLAASPIPVVRNTEKIEGVVHRGRYSRFADQNPR